MTTKQILKRYTKYSDTVKEWMTNLVNDLSVEMSEIPNSYILQLDMLAQACEMLEKAKEEIDNNGLVVRDSRGGLVKNSACAIWNSANLTICKLLNQFAATRLSKAKLKQNTDEFNEEYLDDLMGNDR